MSNTKFSSVEISTLSVASSGYTETRGAAISASDLNFTTGSPDKSIISATFPVSVNARAGKWKIRWFLQYSVTGAPLAHTIYFKKNGVTRRTFPWGTIYIANFPLDYLVTDTISAGVSSKFEFVVHDAGVGGTNAVFRNNRLYAEWIHD